MISVLQNTYEASLHCIHYLQLALIWCGKWIWQLSNSRGCHPSDMICRSSFTPLSYNVFWWIHYNYREVNYEQDCQWIYVSTASLWVFCALWFFSERANIVSLTLESFTAQCSANSSLLSLITDQVDFLRLTVKLQLFSAMERK